MSTHRHIDRICAAVLALTLVLTVLFTSGKALGLQSAGVSLGYEQRLFDPSRVHTINIVMDDWEEFLDGCEDEAYQLCSLIIDGEAVRNAGIRAKGNTSLTSVAAYGNDRYSFKVEFDRYDNAGSYYGLDKLSLNNLIQDNTCMKDFLVYQLMGGFGVASPLCSYVYISVNGEAWGLYLAVEGVEDAFLRRNYGGDSGDLYKPDSMSFGGGRGNGGNFDFQAVAENFDLSDPPAAPARDGRQGGNPGTPGGFEGFRGGGMGSADVKLQYIDDDPESYSNIFNNAKTTVTDADKERLIASLKALSAGESIESTVEIEQVIRYFVVHGFVCNGDSYTGSMVHNYYLYEEDGRLSMIPWDYNLAFGGFQSGDASGVVNEPIDTPVSGGGVEDRPMLAWIFSDEKYTALYHQCYEQFLTDWLESGACETLIDRTAALIAPYVEEDPTKFCTYEAFETGVSVLKTFCQLRSESVRGQLEGTVPSTDQGQQADGSALVDVSGLDLSDMGTMGMGGGPGGPVSKRPGASDEETLPVFVLDPGDFSPPAEGDILDRSGKKPEIGGQPPGDMGSPPVPVSSGAELLPLAASVAVLAAGLLFATLFRRR